jgi:hypothetical protein
MREREERLETTPISDLNPTRMEGEAGGSRQGLSQVSHAPGTSTLSSSHMGPWSVGEAHTLLTPIFSLADPTGHTQRYGFLGDGNLWWPERGWRNGIGYCSVRKQQSLLTGFVILLEPLFGSGLSSLSLHLIFTIPLQ